MLELGRWDQSKKLGGPSFRTYRPQSAIHTTSGRQTLVLSTSAKTTDGIGAVWGNAVANGAFDLEKV